MADVVDCEPDEVPHGRVIVLNGTSSAGKSEIARALQQILPGYPIHTGIDHIHERAPARIHQDALEVETPDFDGFLWIFSEDRSHLTELRLGPAARRLWAGMHAAAAALASTGNDVIVDDLLFDAAVRDKAVATLAGIEPLFVGVRCPIDVAEARERDRDRTPGLARALGGAHQGCVYDIEVDTSVLSPEACASLIERRLHGGPPMGIREMFAASRFPWRSLQAKV